MCWVYATHAHQLGIAHAMLYAPHSIKVILLLATLQVSMLCLNTAALGSQVQWCLRVACSAVLWGHGAVAQWQLALTMIIAAAW